MEMDIKVNDILREVIAFLECLRDAQLPLTLESLREKLLVRSKNTLMARPSSPEPYLDMKSGPRSLLLTRSQADSEEYVGMEESQRHSRAHTHQDYYETFGNENQPASASPGAGIGNDHPEGNEEEQMLIGIYKNLSAMQVRSKCYKCGSLYRKEGKKLFLSESRACWMALVGSHLLIYRSDRHNRPYAIYPIRGYMARAAPNIIPRDRRKSESAFEMYRPGNETLQFIARGPKDMEQWIAKISDVGCEMGSVGSKKEQDCEDERPKGPKGPKRRVTTTVESSVDESKAESASKEGKVGQRKAPPLPARIPRRLPSLPPADPRARLDDDDDDDDIYHRIEDLRNGDLKTRYQNMVLSKKQRADAAADERQQEEEEAYDDVAPKKRNERNEKTEGQEDVVPRDATSFQQTYDDIGTLSRIDGEAGEEFYDDVQNLIPNRRFAKDDVKDQIETSSKLEKKSFLDRVLSRRDSPEKSGKRQRHKGKADNDDASDLELRPKEQFSAGEELPEYNCLPPPRPIYQVQLSEQTQEFYDDVKGCQERRDKDDQQIISPLDTCCNSETEAQSFNGSILLDRDELEHYQLPRSDSCVCDATEVEQDEQLYDDIALWADFTARQRDVLEKRDKKTWNRFAANRKSRVTSDLNNDDVGGVDETEDSPESNGAVKRNTFQKLISRMENSLAKVSARSPSSLSAGKPNVSSSSQV